MCKTKLLAYFGEDDGDIQQHDEEHATDEDIITDDLSHLKALESSSQLRPFRVQGSINQVKVNILTD